MTARILGFIFTLLALLAPAHAQPAAPAPEAPRPGYMVVMGTGTNPEAMGKYSKTLPAIYQKFEGFYIAVGGVGRGVTVLEGTYKQQSLLIAKFPTLDGPNAFWWSPEYRQSVEIRKGAGTFNVIKLKGRPGDAAKPTGKPAYLIGIADIRDPAKVAEYGKKALPLVTAAGGRVIAGGGRKDIELLEGEFGNLTLTVVQFPSLAALRAFYRNPDYQAIIPIRTAGADYTVLEIDGVQAAP